MEVKPGYKKTEVGVIPEQWDFGTLGENSVKIRSGITPTGGERVYKQHGRPFIRSQNVGAGALLLDDVAFVDEATHASFADTEIKSADVLLNITGASIGRTAVADLRIEGGNVNQHVCIIRVNRSKLVPKYLNYFLLSSTGQRQIDSFQAGGNRQGLNFGQVRSIRLPLPEAKEQWAIAEALSDVDALQVRVDRLIAKKRDLKQATMQQLLTGRKRIQGFKAKWTVTVFESLCRSFTKQTGFDYSASIKQSLTFEDTGKSLPFIQNKDFSGTETNYRTDYFIPESVAINFPRILLDERCFLISISGRVGNVGVFSNKRRAFVGGAIAVAKFKDKRYLNWVMYYLQSNEGQNKLLGNVKAGSHQNLILDDLRKIEIPLPSLEEQDEIIAILSGMDFELTALHQRQKKARALKEAMMQELLTGNTRLM